MRHRRSVRTLMSRSKSYNLRAAGTVRNNEGRCQCPSRSYRHQENHSITLYLDGNVVPGGFRRSGDRPSAVSNGSHTPEGSGLDAGGRQLIESSATRFTMRQQRLRPAEEAGTGTPIAPRQNPHPTVRATRTAGLYHPHWRDHKPKAEDLQYAGKTNPLTLHINSRLGTFIKICTALE